MNSTKKNSMIFTRRQCSLGFMLLLFFITGAVAFSQTNTNEQLAIQYYQNKEYDKAVLLFEDLYSKTPTPFIYDYYYNCLLEIKDYKRAQKTC